MQKLSTLWLQLRNEIMSADLQKNCGIGAISAVETSFWGALFSASSLACFSRSHLKPRIQSLVATSFPGLLCDPSAVLRQVVRILAPCVSPGGAVGAVVAITICVATRGTVIIAISTICAFVHTPSGVFLCLRCALDAGAFFGAILVAVLVARGAVHALILAPLFVALVWLLTIACAVRLWSRRRRWHW